MGDDPKKEWDETPPWLAEVLRMIEKQIARTVPQSPVTFVIQRDELVAHLKERADHFRVEATFYKDGTKEVELPEGWLIALGLEKQRPDGSLERAPAKDADEIVAKHLAMLRASTVATLEARAKTFTFMASHLAKVDAFQIDISTAEWLDLVPSVHGIGMGLLAPRRQIVGGDLGVAGTVPGV